MRTETDLRAAFEQLADSAPATEDVLSRMQLDPNNTIRRPASRRRLIAVVAVACLAVILAVAVPTWLANRQDVPVGRVQGNWSLVHRVDAPAGWTVLGQLVQGDEERTLLQQGGSVPETSDISDQCQVLVFGPGASSGPTTPGGTEVEVGSATAIMQQSPADGAAVWWRYADRSWALTTCTTSTHALLIARAVVFSPSEQLRPFRFTELPSGYRPTDAGWGMSDSGYRQDFVQLTPDPGGSGSPISVTEPMFLDPPAAGLPGVETQRINGYPAVIRQDQQSVCLDLVNGAVCVISQAERSNENAPWPTGEKEQLIEVAESLRFADDLKNQQTWFDAQRVFG